MVTWPRRREFETHARSCVGIHSFLSSGEMACWLLVNGSCWGKSFAFKLLTKKGSYHDRYARFLNDLWIAFVSIAFRNWNCFSVFDFFLNFIFTIFFLFFLVLCFQTLAIYIYKEQSFLRWIYKRARELFIRSFILNTLEIGSLIMKRIMKRRDIDTKYQE